MKFNPRWLIGKTIVAIDLRPFDSGRKGPDHKPITVHSPLIFFDDGSHIGFVTQETDVGSYGTAICYGPKPKKERKPKKLKGAL